MRLSPLPLLLAACTSGGPDREERDPSPILGVAETERWEMSGLHAPAYVVRTEGSVPHIYAADRHDLARVQGFVLARDRFFVLDLSRRLSTGRVSALLGDAALSTDAESVASGMKHVADTLHETMAPEHAEMADAFAAGVNDYIEAVRRGELPPPYELELAGVFLGAEQPVDLMEPWTGYDVSAVGATLIYNLGFETGDVGNQAAWDRLPGHFSGAALAELRQAGLLDDVWYDQSPVYDVASGNGWGLETRSGRRPLPASMLARLDARAEAMEGRLRHDHAAGWGSNAWAVMAEKTPDGRALLAGDGHLPLTVPPLFYQLGLDTEQLGGGDTHQLGLVLPGMPILAVGTNGRVAWSQTQLMGDITDWYREQLVLDDAGAPLATVFDGEDRPVVAFAEEVVVKDVPFMGSVGRTVAWTRYTTFDGRWIWEVEGDAVGDDYVAGAGETVVRLGDALVVPRDTDGDGVVTAISFDYTGLDRGNLLGALDRWGHADDVEDMREASKRLVAYSQNIAAADANGSILYTGYQAVPCRHYLHRGEDGRWLDGADPSRLLDGTKYGGFTIPVIDGVVVEEGDDPYTCVVPFDVYPQSVDPERGYVLTANNDPGGFTFDGSLHDDPWYIGGPWIEGYRADTIDRELRAMTEVNAADLDAMQELQANTESAIGRHLAPFLLDAIAEGRALALSEPTDEAEIRVAALFEADEARFEAVEARLEAWRDGGYRTPSGVETFYAAVEPGDAEDAVATMIFNAWMGRFVNATVNDEGFPGGFRPTGDTGRFRLLSKMLAGRGPDNPLGLASWNPDTEESAYFDRLGTAEIETSDEVALQTLSEALDFLESAPVGPGEGGFGTADMDAWIWGYRHWVRFDSILGEFLGDDGAFSVLVDAFSITPERVPLAEGLSGDDPRVGMPGFPRPGDHLAVDAGNSGTDGVTFDYGSGPVFRMAIALGPDGTEVRNILPGGQSGHPDSPYFDDQARLWLGNDAWVVPFTADEVSAAAIGREAFVPASPLR